MEYLTNRSSALNTNIVGIYKETARFTQVKARQYNTPVHLFFFRWK